MSINADQQEKSEPSATQDSQKNVVPLKKKHYFLLIEGEKKLRIYLLTAVCALFTVFITSLIMESYSSKNIN